MNPNAFKATGVIIMLLVFILIFSFVWRSMDVMEDKSKNSALGQVRAAVEQAIMQCYALEGAYPPNLQYLKAHYGLILDFDHYSFLYEVVGENVYPIVDVQLLEDVTQ
ncbi:MAG: hypothetical protein KBG64_02565 [Clostridia bacterium]|nr:hypothetical protein [Clostridia bacterium]